MTFTAAEQKRAAELAARAITEPGGAVALAARVVAMEAIIKEAKSNRYLWNHPTVRRLFERFTALQRTEAV
jgi:hypothetical protein